MTTYYDNNYDHLADELRRLDLLIQLRIMTLGLKPRVMEPGPAVEPSSHPVHANSPERASSEDVDRLLSQNEPAEADPPGLAEIRQQIEALQNRISERVTGSMKQGVFLALPRLAYLFGLSSFEVQTILICLAPELDRKYHRLYECFRRYGRRRRNPEVDLALDLLCDTRAGRWKARAFFSRQATLFRNEIVHMIDDPTCPSGDNDLGRLLKLDPRFLDYLLGNESIDSRLVGVAQVLPPLSSLEHIAVDPLIKTKLLTVARHHFHEQGPGERGMIMYLCGPYGVGKRDLAQGVCRRLNCRMLYLDLDLLLSPEEDLETLLFLAFREGMLLPAALYLDHAEALQEENSTSRALMKRVAMMIEEYGQLTFLAGEKPWVPRGLFQKNVVYPVTLPVPDAALREEAWKAELERLGAGADPGWAGALARRFRLTPGQIRDAAEQAQNQGIMAGGPEALSLSGLYDACRSQSNQKLGELAVKIEPRWAWEDLILPEGKMTQLREICGQVKHHYRVFDEWGFDRKFSHGKGLSVLFEGPSGTGKTMAAEVIAHELHLDLYKVDLSCLVSKYIGETEKNLSRIFHEAETSNAILFFDEADALFGKRTKVADAHDRFANIEVSYLLQKMEEYEGVVILATNLRQNMDEAFTRRIRFIVEFLSPDEQARQRIWETHFPKDAPVSAGIDMNYLAKQFRISGGNIRNIVMNAAFLAAEDGAVIGMEHILHGAKREYEKIGGIWEEKVESYGRRK